MSNRRPKPRPSLVLLSDADGTLFDSFPLYNRAIDAAMMPAGLADVPYETYYRDFNNTFDIIPGTSWAPIFRMLLDYTGNRDTAVDVPLQAFYAATVALVEEEGDSLLLTHAKGLLEAVAAAGGVTHIHTGTSRPIADALVRATGVSHLVSGIECGDEIPSEDGDYRHHKVNLISKASAPYADDAPRVVLGDTKADVRAANALGIPVGFVYRGYPKDPSVLDFDHIYSYGDGSDAAGGREMQDWILSFASR